MITADKARELLVVSETYSAQELKKAFRRASFLCHPDSGGSEERFNELVSAYKLLQPGAQDGKSASTTLVDGTPLSEVGQGYPITEAARACDRCDGHGYVEYTDRWDMEDVTCPTCNGDKLMSHPCKHCNGTGQYTHPKTGKIVGECRRCKGTGKFYPWNKRQNASHFSFFERVPNYIPGTQKRGINCDRCGGYGHISVEKKHKSLKQRCPECRGIGEVKMFNPVIHRGFLNSKNQS